MDWKPKPGDRVTVIHNREPRSVHTVQRVLQRFVELDDGSQWSEQYSCLRPYPRRKGSRLWHQPTLEPYKPEHTEAIKTTRLRGEARRAVDLIEWDRVTAQNAIDLIEVCAQIEKTPATSQ